MGRLAIAALVLAACSSSSGPAGDRADAGGGSATGAEVFVKASNTGQSDYFGTASVLSADGSTLAVGAPGEASAAIGIDGDQSDHSKPGTGAVYVFTRAGEQWSQQAYVKASGPTGSFGESVALSADGNTLAVGASGEAGATGAAYLFARAGGQWSQQARVQASNAAAMYLFGSSIALSGDGGTLAVGSKGEASDASGIDGDQTDTSATYAGAVYVFTGAGAAWTQQAYVKAGTTLPLAAFGTSVALSSDGGTLAVGAYAESSAATGIDGDPTGGRASMSGAAYVFVRAAATWSQQAYVKASNTAANAGFGDSVALAADGNTLAVGAEGEASAATGIDSDQTDMTALSAGAAYVFARAATTWSQQAYVKASNTDPEDGFGGSVSISADGNTVVISAAGEASTATGVGGDQASNGAIGAGAAYVFARAATTWSQQTYLKATNTAARAAFGGSVAVSGDAGTIAVGAIGDTSGAIGIGGTGSDGAINSGAAYVLE